MKQCSAVILRQVSSQRGVRLAAGNIVAVAAITEVEEAIVSTRHLAAGLTLVGAHVGIVPVAEIVTRE